MSRARGIRNWFTAIVFVGLVAIMDYSLLNYLVSHGLQSMSYPMQIAAYQIVVPLLSLTFVGVLIVAMAAWTHMLGTMPIMALREMSHLEAIRILRAGAVALFLFSAVLFLPYIVGSSAFWMQMASLGRTIPQLGEPLQGLLTFVQPAMALDSLTKLVLSQNIAAGALVAISGLIGYSQRRMRRAR